MIFAGGVGVNFFWLRLFLVIGPQSFGGETQTLEIFEDRMSGIEGQVDLACGGKDLETHFLKAELADRLISREGPLARMERDLKAAARVVAGDLEYARERVESQVREVHSRKIESQRLKVEEAVRHLRKVGESGRERLQSEVGRYQQLKEEDPLQKVYQDPEQKQDFKNRVHQVIEVRKKELQGLLALSSRADRARMKAAMCYCRAHDGPSDDRCADDPQSMEKKMQLLKSVQAYENLRKGPQSEAK